MAATEESTKRCPRCGAPLDATAYASGLPFACTSCGAKVRRRPVSGESPTDADTMPPEERTPQGWLDELQDLLIRMILGIPRFFFQELPRRIVETIRAWFPTLWKACIVLVLALTWFAVAAGPMFFVLGVQGEQWGWRSYVVPLPGFYLDHARAWNYAVAVYTLLALYASIRGALRRRLRRLRAAVGPRATVSS